MKIEYNQLIDALVERPTRDSIVCESTIPEWAPIFENHFPGNPIMPGALLIEMMAQSGGFIHMLETDFSQMGYLAGVKSAKFRESVGRLQHILIKTKVIHWGDTYLVCKSKITDTQNKCFAESTLVISFQDFPSEEVRQEFVSTLDENGLVKYPF